MRLGLAQAYDELAQEGVTPRKPRPRKRRGIVRIKRLVHQAGARGRALDPAEGLRDLRVVSSRHGADDESHRPNVTEAEAVGTAHALGDPPSRVPWIGGIAQHAGASAHTVCINCRV